MSVTTTNSRVQYVGDAATTVFAYPFEIFAVGDIRVYVSGVLKTLTVDYTVAGAGNQNGGNVSFGVPPAASAPILFIRVITADQQTRLPGNDKFPSTTVELSLDKLTLLIQQLQEIDQRTPKLAVTSLFANTQMDDPVVGQFLNWKTTGIVGSSALAESGLLPDPVTVLHGGTGATTAAAARANLGITNAALFFNVKDYGAVGDGVTADTAAVQAAIDAAKVAGGVVWCPPGIYVVGPLNLTNCINGILFDGAGVNATRFMPDTAVTWTTKHIFDCTASAFLTFRYFQVGAFNQTPVPVSCFLLAQKNGSSVSNAFHFDGIYVTGLYSVSPLYAYGVPSWDAVNCDFYNYKAGAGAHCVANLNNSNPAGAVSQFQTIAAGAQSISDITFSACEFHKFAGAGADNTVIYLSTVKDVRVIGGNISGGAARYVETAGQVDRVTFMGTEFETEGEPVTPTSLLQVGATGATDITFNECLALCTAFVGGAGTYDSKGGAGAVHFGHVSAGGTLAQPSTNYLGPVGTEANEANAHTIAQFDGVLTGLFANAGGSPGVGKNFTITVMVNNAATALTLAINGGAVSGSDVAHYVNVARGDTISFRWMVDAGANIVGGQIAQCAIQPRPQTAF